MPVAHECGAILKGMHVTRLYRDADGNNRGTPGLYTLQQTLHTLNEHTVYTHVMLVRAETCSVKRDTARLGTDKPRTLWLYRSGSFLAMHLGQS